MSEGAPGTGVRNGRAELTPELRERLREVERAVSPDQLSELWVFPPLEELKASSEFLLFTRRLGGGRMRVCSALVDREDGGTRVVAHGEVPEDRMPRFVERFRRRLDEERDPIHVQIGGRPERWRSLVGPDDGVGAGAEVGPAVPDGPGDLARAGGSTDRAGTEQGDHASREPSREAA